MQYQQVDKFSPQQVAQLTEIGSSLQQRRLQFSLPLEHVATKTRIRLGILKAIEESKLELLPEAIYLRGFIRIYGDFLEMDGIALASAFTDAPPPTRQEDRDLEAPITRSLTEIFKPYLPHFIYASLLGISILILFLFLNRPTNQQQAQQESSPAVSAPTEVETATPVEEESSPVASAPTQTETVTNSPQPTTNNQQPTTKPESPPVKEESLPAVSPLTEVETATPVEEESSPVASAPTQTETVTNSPQPTTTPITVKIEMSGSSWLRITVDGKVEFEGILEEGEKKSWNANQTVKIRSGNAGAVNFSQDQNPLQPMGKLGEVKDIILSANASE